MKQSKIDNLKLLIMDVDGVLTDGMYYFENGLIAEKFDAKDAVGIKLWKNKGLKTMILTGSDFKLIEKRAKRMEIDYLLMNKKDKEGAIMEFLSKNDMKLEEIAYIGDDINDLPLLKKVGFSASVADGIDEVKKLVDYVTKRDGGKGRSKRGY